MDHSLELKNPVIEQRKKIHPHKFTLWVGMGSHYYDVCRFYERIYRKTRCAGMDNAYCSTHFLVLVGRYPDQQPDYALCRKIISTQGKGSIPKTDIGHRRVGRIIHFDAADCF